MLTRISAAATPLILLLALGSCGEGPTAAPGPSWFHASLSGEVNTDFNGMGDFAALRDFGGSPYYLQIIGRDSMDATAARQWIFFHSNTAARPTPGSYTLVPHETVYGSSEGWTGLVSRTAGQPDSGDYTFSNYVIESGTLTITHSTDQVLEGSFHVVAVLTERSGGKWVDGTRTGFVERRDPRFAPDPAAPSIEATGDFRVNFFDEDAQVGYGSPGVECATC